jgi:hypothetical protein
MQSDLIITPETPTESLLRKNLLDTLNRHYPHMSGAWVIDIDSKGGIIQVRNLALSGRMGFVMHINKIDPDFKNVVRFGGELLERYNIARQRGLDMRDQLSNLRRNALGEAIHEV